CKIYSNGSSNIRRDLHQSYGKGVGINEYRTHSSNFRKRFKRLHEKYCNDFYANCPDFSSILLRSEEHTSELQSRFDLVCRLLLEKKNNDLLTTMYVTCNK